MNRLLCLLVLLLYCKAQAADRVPHSIDEVIEYGFDGTFLGLNDPGYITIRLDNGNIIDTRYSDVEFNIHTEWDYAHGDSTSKQRRVNISYRNAEGVILKDYATGEKFRLSGIIENHPIDVADDICGSSGTTYIMKHCHRLAIEAGEAEMLRAYNDLGGEQIEMLLESQVAWEEYAAAYSRVLYALWSGPMAGSGWAIQYLSRKKNVVRERARQLKIADKW